MKGVDLDEAFSAVLTAGATPVSAPAGAIRPGVRYAYNKDPRGQPDRVDPAWARRVRRRGRLT